MAVARFAGGGHCDLARRHSRPAATAVAGQPGDDLNALANQYGTVSLAAEGRTGWPSADAGAAGDAQLGS